MYALTLARQIEGLRKREFSARELWEAHRARPDRCNAFLQRFDEFVEPVEGPLRGVPVSIKDSLHMAGLPTSCGSRYKLAPRATADATAVARLRAAGAVIAGKTNCPEFLANYETDNALAGWTANPWSAAHSAGGSSGGEGAAIADGLSAGGVGSDGGGSIRVPAHFCGIAGLKPTPGRVSAAGHVPEIAHPGGLLGVAGPMARTVEDVRILFEVLAGYDPADPFSAPVELRRPETAGVLIGLMEGWGGVPVAPEIVEAVRRAGRLLEASGFAVEPFAPRGMERATQVWDFFFNVVTDPLKRQIIASDPSLVHWTGTELLQEPPAHPTGVEVVTQLAVRDKLRGAMLRQMAGTPVLLLPVCSVPAFRPRERNWEIGGRSIGLLDAMSCVTPFNLFGMPGLTVPMGFTAEGLPIGVQLAGLPYSEELLLALGERLEHARGPFPCAFS